MPLEYFKIAETLGLKNENGYCRHPLAFITEAADDIAYLTADIEDAHHKGIISVDDIIQYIREFDGSSHYYLDICKAVDMYRNEAHIKCYPRQEDYVMHRLRILIKGFLINAVGDILNSYYCQIMEGACNQELLMLSDIKNIVMAIKKLEEDKIYYSREIIETKTRASVVIKQLLQSYVLGVLNYDEKRDKNKDTENNLIYQSISPNYRFICELNNTACSGKDCEYNKLRLVIDQISGMTDSRALTVYDILTAG